MQLALYVLIERLDQHRAELEERLAKSRAMADTCCEAAEDPDAQNYERNAAVTGLVDARQQIARDARTLRGVERFLIDLRKTQDAFQKAFPQDPPPFVLQEVTPPLFVLLYPELMPTPGNRDE